MATDAKAQEEKRSFPHKYEDILKDFGASNDTSSPAKVPSKVKYPGIFDQPKKKRYWVDWDGNNCFVLYARALTITFGEDDRYWRWNPVYATSSVYVDAAELLDVLSLEVKGEFETAYLTPGTVYEVSYIIMMKDPKYGWEDKVEFSVTPPQNLQIIPRNSTLDLRTKGRWWSYVRVAEFTTSPGQSGRMYFMLRQTVGKWKKGLVIKGVDITPK
ncbi:unnamed protein product [Malus baccata var. baccata]